MKIIARCTFQHRFFSEELEFTMALNCINLHQKRWSAAPDPPPRLRAWPRIFCHYIPVWVVVECLGWKFGV